MIEYLSLLVLGAVIGILSSVLGVGGGVLIVPLLPLFTQITHKETIATSLFTVFFIVLANTIGFHRKKLVAWNVVLFLAPLASAIAFICGNISTTMSDQFLKSILAGLLFLFSVRLFLSKRKSASEAPSKRNKIKVFLLSIAAGVATGFTGIGAGVLLSPALLFLNLVKNEEVSPTTNGIMTFTTLLGALGFVRFQEINLSSGTMGFVRLDYAIILAIVAMTFAIFGRRYQAQLSFGPRKYILGSLLMVFALKELSYMFFKG